MIRRSKRRKNKKRILISLLFSTFFFINLSLFISPGLQHMLTRVTHGDAAGSKFCLFFPPDSSSHISVPSLFSEMPFSLSFFVCCRLFLSLSLSLSDSFCLSLSFCLSPLPSLFLSLPLNPHLSIYLSFSQ